MNMGLVVSRGWCKSLTLVLVLSRVARLGQISRPRLGPEIRNFPGNFPATQSGNPGLDPDTYPHSMSLCIPRYVALTPPLFFFFTETTHKRQQHEWQKTKTSISADF